MSAVPLSTGGGFDRYTRGWNFLPRRRALPRTGRRGRLASAVSAVCAGALSATALAAWSAAAGSRIAGERTRPESDLAVLAASRSAVRPAHKQAAGQNDADGPASAQMDEAPGRLVELMRRLGAAAQDGVIVERLTQTSDGAQLTIRAHDGPGAVRWFRQLIAWPIAERAELVGIRAAGSRHGMDGVELKVSLHWQGSNAEIVHAAGPSAAVRELR